jgi:hypothetical protein
VKASRKARQEEVSMRRNRFGKALLASIAVLAMLVGGAAIAQEQVGSIEGFVTDRDGTALPGVTVEAMRTGQSALVAVTDVKGEFRFPRLSSGVYKLTAKLDGFVTAEVPSINLELGRTLRVNFTLQEGTFEDTITVAADTVAIDVSQSSTAMSISREQIDLLPRGRDFSSMVTLAAGAADESFAGGISIDGASGSENRFIIDGVDTTHPQDGLQGEAMITDFIEEVQVKTAGYAAEYGGSLGGVINAITKTGGNEFSGSVGFYYTDSAWSGKVRPTEYLSDPTYFRTFSKDDQTRFEPGFQLGGPIVKDKLWFFFAYQPAMTSTDRTPDGSTTTFGQDTTVDYASGNIKGNIGSSFLYKIAGNYATAERKGELPALDGTTPADADLVITTKFPSYSYSLYGDYIASDTFLMSGRVGYYLDDVSTSGVDATRRLLFRNGDICAVTGICAGDPNYHPTGWSSVPNASFQSTDEDKWERSSAGLDASFFFDAAGTHQVKFGAQYEKIKNAVGSGEAGNLYTFRWGLSDRFGAGVKGTYGSLGVRRFRTQGGAESTNYSIFVQDSWAVSKNVTINYGVRAEQERVPNYGAVADPSLPANAMEFDFNDKLAPRLGFAWDVMGDQSLKIYGSYGNYYDITKLEMPRGSFGGDHWIEWLYPVNTTDYLGMISGCSTSTNDPNVNVCPGLGPAEAILDLRHPTDPGDAVDPNLKPMQQREYQIGADYQLNSASVVGFRYVNKSLLDTIEDVGTIECEGTICNEVYYTANPGKGLVGGDPDGSGPIQPQAEAIRDYEAVELTYNRRFQDNWLLRASYTYSKLSGNYSGLASSDEFGRTDPNVARYFDGLVYGYDRNGDLVDGVLNTDRPHAVEIQGVYRFNFGTNVGANTSWRSGTPTTSDVGYAGVNFFPNGRNDLGRTPSLTQTDLFISHPFKIGGFGLEVSLNVLNLFDEDTVTRRRNTPYYDDLCDHATGCGFDEFSAYYYFTDVIPYTLDTIMADAERWETFNQPIAWQAPRAVRLGVKFTF